MAKSIATSRRSKAFKVTDEKEDGKPSLRRASTKTGEDKGKTTDDDRPTLHRRDNN